MTERTLAIDGIRVSRFLYGSAWKEDRTQQLTELALERGFRGTDTANQPRHYDEAAVGRAIAASIAGGQVVPGRPVPADQVILWWEVALDAWSPGLFVKLSIFRRS